MDQKQFKECASRLEAVAKVLDKLPPEVRLDTFNLLKEYITGHTSRSDRREERTPEGETDDGEFFGKFDHDKPAGNAMLIAANFYREYGSAPFSVEEVRKAADEVGITIPARVDMTYNQAKEKGKKLFTKAGRGHFKPTVHGETYLKATYSVKKGTKIRPEPSK